MFPFVTQNQAIPSHETSVQPVTGQMTVGPNVQVGATTTGFWLGTQTVNLNGGEVWLASNASVGWNNPFAVTAGTTTSAIVNNATSTGAIRSIILNGVISGGGPGSTLAFRNQGYMPFDGTTGSKGFIITRDSTFEGTIRVENTHATYGSFLRIGGANTTTTDGRNLGAGGNFGSLHANADVVLAHVRSALLLMRNDAHTFANPISGTGELWVGHSTLSDTSTDNQVVNLTGTHTFTGATKVLSGGSPINSFDATATCSGPLNFASGTSKIGGAFPITLSGLVTGTGGFEKVGSGAVTCTTVSLGYTGAITVSEGTMNLSFPATGGFRNAPITIGNGATLAVASINALQYQTTDVLVKSGGTLFLNAGVTSNIGNNSGSFTMQGGATLGSAADTNLAWGSWSISTPGATINISGGKPQPAVISAIWVTTGTLLNLNVTNLTANAGPDLIVSGSLGRPGNTMGVTLTGGGTVLLNARLTRPSPSPPRPVPSPGLIRPPSASTSPPLPAPAPGRCRRRPPKSNSSIPPAPATTASGRRGFPASPTRPQAPIPTATDSPTSRNTRSGSTPPRAPASRRSPRLTSLPAPSPTPAASNPSPAWFTLTNPRPPLADGPPSPRSPPPATAAIPWKPSPSPCPPNCSPRRNCSSAWKPPRPEVRTWSSSSLAFPLTPNHVSVTFGAQ
jgi:hypothetical protein